MARVIGNAVLPDLPYSPNLNPLPSVNITRDTLAGYNAKIEMGQGLTSKTPRPAPTVSKMPVVSVPQSTPLSMEAQAMGAGYGQGIVPMTPRPAPTQINIPRVDVPVGSMAQDYALQNYDLMGQGITPERNTYAQHILWKFMPLLLHQMFLVLSALSLKP